MTTSVFFPVGVSNQSTSGTLAALNDAVTLATDSLGSVGVNLSGTNAGATVVIEGLIAGTTWDTIKVYPLVAGAAGVMSITAAGDFEFNCAAFKQVRARLSVAGSGSFSATLNGTGAAKHMAVKNGNPADMQVQPVPASIPPTDRSGSIAAGGTAQVLMAANANRRAWWIQNNSSGDLWLNEIGGTAVLSQPSIQIQAGALYETPASYCSPSAISIIGATTGQTFTAREA
ncbi:hypothetical protein [Cupriavidus basilensis]|uniref:Uncharacterized protein n=1 Tax=Cupriavidus basilensis TaxID=68895 RepID=A0A0C4Y7Z6_9BURK|nr:hypothetical protein [Cupriavidus basilensis]AJG19088.1 hypothetical protein RR42_m1691 [Cupriavidus basilensis]